MIFALIVAATSFPTAGGVDALVSRLGPESDYRSVEEIARHGCRAVPALVRQLEIVRTDRVPFLEAERHPREMRVLWSIATLRYISGRDFYAGRSRRMDPVSTAYQMLTVAAPPGMSEFYGIWPSREIAYFASPAEQRAIIAQWRRYDWSGACRHSRPNSDFMFWLHGVGDES